MKIASWGAKFKVLILLILVVLTTAGSAWIIFQIIRVQTVAVETKEIHRITQDPAVERFAFAFELKNLAVPLSSRFHNQSGYAQFSLVLESPSAEAKEWMELNRAKLISLVIETSSEFSMDDFLHPGGFQKFKDSLQKRCTKQFGNHAPSSIAIRDWMMN